VQEGGREREHASAGENKRKREIGFVCMREKSCLRKNHARERATAREQAHIHANACERESIENGLSNARLEKESSCFQ